MNEGRVCFLQGNWKSDYFLCVHDTVETVDTLLSTCSSQKARWIDTKQQPVNLPTQQPILNFKDTIVTRFRLCESKYSKNQLVLIHLFGFPISRFSSFTVQRHSEESDTARTTREKIWIIALLTVMFLVNLVGSMQMSN